MPFEANRTLAAALQQPTPVVLRDYEAMVPFIKTSVVELQQAVTDLRQVELKAAPHDHSASCEACTVIENMQLRYSHDLGLLSSQAATLSDLHSKISQHGKINHPASEDLLATCLITRAVLDNLVRSCALFLKHDIRVYNKYLAESLASLRKLVWSTLPHSIDSQALPLLDSYTSLSGSKRNDSELFADPFPTFSRKIVYLRGIGRDQQFNDFFDLVSDLYGALSDLIHGGIGSLAVANPNNPYIVVGRSPLRYSPFAYQVAEVAGISIITSLKALASLYLPALIQSLGWIGGTQEVTAKLSARRSALAERIEGMVF